MKICLVGPGTEIPPKSWGACEIIVWDYYENLKKVGYDACFISNRNNNVVIDYIKKGCFDVVHIMYDDLIILAPHIHNSCKLILYTTHWAYLPQVYTNNKMYAPFQNLLKQYTHVQIFALSEQIKQVYMKANIPENRIRVIHNGAREDLFRYAQSPAFSERSIYVGKIEMRKRQYLYESIAGLYFVGQIHNSSFPKGHSRYLGSWDKNQLYEGLTDYANILLMSDGEADPLVLKEALMAGLGVVCNETSCANLDSSKDFITVIPDDKYDDISYVQNALEENRKVSLLRREEIREYALTEFSWKNIIQNDYLKNIRELLDVSK
jgi:glycosyltransferase involved in cell wall biosynthesis